MRGEVELVVEPELDIVCVFARRPSAAAITEASERAFEALARTGWHVAKLRLETEWLRRSHPWIEADAPTATVVRLCLIKPEHLGWSTSWPTGWWPGLSLPVRRDLRIDLAVEEQRPRGGR